MHKIHVILGIKVGLHSRFEIADYGFFQPQSLRGDATDIGLPEEGTEGHLALLLAEHLANHARREPGMPMPEAVLCRHTARLAIEHQAHWRKSMTEPNAEVAATAQTIDRLVALNLVERTPEGVIPLPAIARYAVAPPGTGGAPGSRGPRQRKRGRPR